MDLSNIIKNLSVAAVDSSNPVQITTGLVTSINPLVITPDQMMPLPAEAFILTRSVIDHEISVTVNWHTESKGSGGNSYDAFSSHSHSISGTKTIKINNGLKIGDIVILLRQQGGQKFVVLDKVVSG